MSKKKFIERRPNYFSGFEDSEYEVDNFEQILEIPFVKKWWNQNTRHSIPTQSLSILRILTYLEMMRIVIRWILMVMNNWDD